MFEVHCDVRDGHWASLPELRGEPLIPALPGVQSCRLLQVEFKGPFILNGRLVFSGARRVDSPCPGIQRDSGWTEGSI